MTSKPASRLGPPPSQADIRQNLQPAPTQSSEKSRFINARVTKEQFVDIKVAALKEGVSLGDYILLVHEAYQRR